MTRYQKYMQEIHSVSTAYAIELGALLLTEDILDYLIKSGIKADSKIIKDVRNIKKYEYKPYEDSNTKS